MASDGFPFLMERQDQTKWCWAATAVSIKQHYSGVTHPQCFLVSDVFGMPQCCDDPIPAVCNKTGSLAAGLTQLGHLDHVER